MVPTEALITNDSKYLLFKLRLLFISNFIAKIGIINVDSHTLNFIEYEDRHCHCESYGIIDNYKFVAGCYCYEGEEGSYDFLNNKMKSGENKNK